MAKVIGVRFKNTSKVYFFDPLEFDCPIGVNVVVETSRGMEMGEVVVPKKEVSDDKIVSPLKEVIRIATPEDIKSVEENAKFEKDASVIAEEKIQDLGLDMKLVGCEYAFDRSKIIFYFTSGGRVDFRELVKILAQAFKMRIELRQIGVRDEAKMIGGLGSCGNEICCRRFLGDFEPVTIRMARDQGLSLNPTKISGLCGRLMCCLKYEQDNYEAVRKVMPKVGKAVITPDGEGVVVEQNIIGEKLKVNVNGEIREYPMDSVTRIAPKKDKFDKNINEDVVENSENDDVEDVFDDEDMG
ncbi:MAG: stage 0 sporulation protein [Clostridiales bacterium]|nr:stage 0 sporulation protein [Clostridiales bacterium]MBQ2818668.1 stage 0 sporulation family protein [Clostridia bacterium]